MRITGGSLRGRTITIQKGEEIRPTSSKVRAAVYDVLLHRALPQHDRELESCTFLDACAGSGIMGFEALSRGAQSVIFMDKNRQALRAIEHNAKTFDVSGQAKIMVADVLTPPYRDAPVDIVYIDPPYKQDLIPKAAAALERAGWIGPGTICVFEEASRLDIDLPAHYETIQDKTYGVTQVLFKIVL